MLELKAKNSSCSEIIQKIKRENSELAKDLRIMHEKNENLMQ